MANELMTVGYWRKRLAGLPDDAPVLLFMSDEPPANLDIELTAIEAVAKHPFGMHFAVSLRIIDTENEELLEDDE